jgi:nucleotide-binding universal stress UspA family protein
MKPSKVVVPLDGSLESEAIAPFIREIAGPLDCDVLLLRVLEPLGPPVADGPQVIVDAFDARRNDAVEYLAPIAAELRARGVRVETGVRRGQPVDEILAAVRESGADMVAMTTHGRGGLNRLLFGSVAEGVLRRAEVPVFLMRQTAAQLEATRTVRRPA